MLKKKFVLKLFAPVTAAILLLAGCGTGEVPGVSSETSGAVVETGTVGSDAGSTSEVIDIGSIPEYSGDIYIEINGNIPYFTEDEYTTEVFETYSDLDSLGRCGVAYANICQELMPTEERGDISSVYPTGWVQNSYEFVDGKAVFNRSHLIGFQLARENDNELNLITGTRTMNVVGMLPFENMVADYVKETDNHVLYRVTPLFEGDNLLASGVLMEAWSVEDGGDGVCFCVYVYNVEPGVVIDYLTGENWADTDYEAEGSDTSESDYESSVESGEENTYVLNTNTMRFHYPDCESVTQMNESNKEEVTTTREELIEEGYSPYGNCNP